MQYTPIAGTHGRRAESGTDWFQAGSDFDRMMAAHGWERNAERFMFWSTDLVGTFFSSGHRAWRHGGDVLAAFLTSLPYDERIILAHSHGGQVAAYGIRQARVFVRALVTIDSPIRRDMDETWRQAEPYVYYHEHLYTPFTSAWTRWLGQRLRFKETMPWADQNTRVEGGHSGCVRDTQHMSQWEPVLKRLAATESERPDAHD